MLVGSEDPSSPIFGMDYVPLEFIRLGKTNLTYDVCLGCDHFLSQKISVDGQEEVNALGGEYTEKILEWIKNQSKVS